MLPKQKKQKNYRTIGLILEAIRLSANFISSTKIEHVQTKESKNVASTKIATTTNDSVKHRIEN